MRRRLALLAGWTLGLIGLAGPAASAEFLGTDVIGNVSPESQVADGLADRYPLSAYALDYHVDVGLTDPDGVAPMVAHWAAAQLWSMTSFLVKLVVDLFTWAFSLDLLGGDPTRSADGALAPVSDAITGLYERVIGQSWMVVAILIAGLWGIWKALVQRRYTETAGALSVSVLFVLIALFFVYQPERTIGEASRWTNTMSLAFLSGANRGSLDDPQQAKRQVADHLFGTLVHEPWVVLEFGGLRHCVDTGRTNDEGFPRPVSPHDPARDVCRDHLRSGRDGHGGYAPRFLRQPAGSDARDAEYDALKKGELPDDSERQFAGYRVDKADSPAVDIQQAGGAFQRLTVATVVFLGTLGAVALLGFLALAVILAQVLALVLLGFAPVALVIGIFPGAGHAFFRGWLTKLATAIFIKALYSLVIAVVVAVSAALAASTAELGFLLAFGLQAVFYWAIFLYRKQISARLVAATTGAAGNERLPRMTVVQRGAEIAARPFSAMAGAAAHGLHARRKQQSALAGSDELDRPGPDGYPGIAAADGRPDAGEPSRNGGALRPAPGDPLRANGTRPAPGAILAGAGAAGTGVAPAREPPAAAATKGIPHSAATGNGAAATDGEPAPSPSDPSVSPAAAGAGNGGPARDTHGQVSPRAAHEDVMRRARELRERQRTAAGGSDGEK